MKKILFLILCIVLGLSACSKGEDTTECAETANTFVTAFKNKDFETMYNMTLSKEGYLEGTYDSTSVIGQKLFNAMTENLSFEITDTSVSGNNCSINAHIVTIDTFDILSNVVNEYADFCRANGDNMNDEEFGQALENILDEHLATPSVYEKDTVLNLVHKNNTWLIEDSVATYDDLTGGYLTYCFGMNNLSDMPKLQ